MRSRVRFYRSIADQLPAAVDGMTTVKGLGVADLYPAGWVRYMNDIDFVAPDESGLWRAVGEEVEESAVAELTGQQDPAMSQ